MIYKRQSPRSPEIAVQGRDLVLQCGHRAQHLGRALAAGKHRAAGQGQGGVLGVAARQGEQGGFFGAIQNAADARPVDGASAHGAGGDQRALGQIGAGVVGRRRARQRALGVVHGVDVALLGQHRLAIVRNEQRAKRVVAPVPGALGHSVGAAQQRGCLGFAQRRRVIHLASPGAPSPWCVFRSS